MTNPTSLNLDEVKDEDYSGSNTQIHFVMKLCAKTKEGYLLPRLISQDMTYIPALEKYTRKLGFFTQELNEFIVVEKHASLLGCFANVDV